jgi:hypothetical protein
VLVAGRVSLHDDPRDATNARRGRQRDGGRQRDDGWGEEMDDQIRPPRVANQPGRSGSLAARRTSSGRRRLLNAAAHLAVVNGASPANLKDPSCHFVVQKSTGKKRPLFKKPLVVAEVANRPQTVAGEEGRWASARWRCGCCGQKSEDAWTAFDIACVGAPEAAVLPPFEQRLQMRARANV